MANPTATARAADLTRRLLLDAGLTPGMRVLDIGTGLGDVALLALEIVGPSGSVLGIDRAAPPLQVAAQRVEAGVGNIAFEQRDLADLGDLAGFDAVIGRRVLMYQPDAVAALIRLRRVLKPGGLIVLQEHDATGMPISAATIPAHRDIHDRIWRTVAHEGADTRMGRRLAAALGQAGFRAADLRAEAILLTPEISHPIAAIAHAMLPRLREAGAADGLDLDSLDTRLEAERMTLDEAVVWELAFGTWARNPD